MSILNFIANYKKKVDAQKEELVRLQKLNDILKEEISKNSKTLYELEHDISFGINDLMSNSADIMDIDNKSVNEGKIQDTLNDYKRLCCQIRLMEKWKKQYQDDLIQAKDNLKSFLSSHREKIKDEIIHDLYRRTFLFEYEILRDSRINIKKESLSLLKWQLKEEKRLYEIAYLTSDIDVSNLCDDYLKLNIIKLVKEMKYSDWTTIQTKIGVVFENMNNALNNSGYKVSDTFFRRLCRYLEAKYLVIQKQEMEKEQEREEREAQREYDRAIKKAQKEEETAQREIEKKEKELLDERNQEKTNELQKQIAELKMALYEARSLRERAMSMAQQTKAGYVYIISNIGSFGKDVYKIGMTRRLNPMERVVELSNASVPFPFDVHAFIYSEDAPTLETELHRTFEDRKVNSINYRKEYFHVSLEEIKAAIRKKGVEAVFVDIPDAFQYRECLNKQQLRDEL